MKIMGPTLPPVPRPACPKQSLDEPMNPLLEVAGRVDVDHLCVLLRTDRDERPTNEEKSSGTGTPPAVHLWFVLVDLE